MKIPHPKYEGCLATRNEFVYSHIRSVNFWAGMGGLTNRQAYFMGVVHLRKLASFVLRSVCCAIDVVVQV